MWVILHWYFLYICRPNPLFHAVAGIVLLTYDKVQNNSSIEKIQSAVGMLLMYVGFYLRLHILDYGFLPWWVLSIIGLRDREVPILLGGIALGIYFISLNWIQIAGHVVMNIGRLIRTSRMNHRMHGLVHTVLGFTIPFITEVEIDGLPYKEILAIASAIILVKSKDKMDWFSLLTVYVSPTSLSLAFLHAMAPNWYEYYKNNHFRIVKGSYFWLAPIAVVLYRVIFEFETMAGISDIKSFRL